MSKTFQTININEDVSGQLIYILQLVSANLNFDDLESLTDHPEPYIPYYQ